MNDANQVVPGSMAGSRSLSDIGYGAIAQSDRMDLSESLSFFQRHLRMILAWVAAGLVCGILVTFLQERVYTATATVDLTSPEVLNAGDTAARSGTAVPSSSYVDTQVALIESRQMATQVAKEVGLLQGVDNEERKSIIDRLQTKVDAQREGESFALNITFDSDTGESAAGTVNEFARQFIGWELGLTREATQQSLELIEERLAELRKQAQADTAALQRYRIDNNLLSTTGSSLTEQEISSYNQAVTRARAEATEDQARLQTALRQIREGSSGDDLGEALGSSVIASLRAREAQVGGEVANLGARYGSNHPELIRARSELAEIRSLIDSEINRVISNLRAEANVSAQRLASLTESLEQARGQLSRNNAAMVGLVELERNAEVSQGLYETYLENYQQLAAGDGTERPNARVLSFAEAPTLPASPNVILNLLLSLVFGLGIGLVASYIAEATFKGVTGPEQIERDLGKHFLGSIPLISSIDRNLPREVNAIGAGPRSAFAESFRSLATSIAHATNGPGKIIAIGSALPKEGKSVTSICLGQTFARSGKTTVVVDCDEAQRGVSRLLDLDNDQPGLIELLNGECALDDVLIHSVDGVSVLPIMPRSDDKNNSEPPLGGPYMDELLKGLSESFDHVVLDLPPFLPVAVARDLALKADATVMVVRWRTTRTDAVRAALRQINPMKVNVIGIALTQVDIKKHGLFNKSDPNFYYSQYASYYS